MSRPGLAGLALRLAALIAVFMVPRVRPGRNRPGSGPARLDRGRLRRARRSTPAESLRENPWGRCCASRWPRAFGRDRTAQRTSRPRLLDPLLEPYAFVLPDALDSLSPTRGKFHAEIGSLWQPGAAQPAWVELLRARRFVVESDGGGADAPLSALGRGDRGARKARDRRTRGLPGRLARPAARPRGGATAPRGWAERRKRRPSRSGLRLRAFAGTGPLPAGHESPRS